MHKTGAALLGTILLCGCGGGSQPAVNAAENMAVANEADAMNYQAEVMGLPLNARQGVFLRAVRDAGLTCQEVTESERLKDAEGNPTWRATCDGDSPHIISITRDGTAKVMSRSDAR
jgi:hypothetical protein